MKPMQAGKLRKQVAIQQDQGATVDATNSHVPNWVTIRTSYAAIEPLSGRELMQAAQVRPDVTHKITMRFRPDVPLTPAMRIMFPITNGRIFNIQSILNTEELGREWVVLAKELVEV